MDTLALPSPAGTTPAAPTGWLGQLDRRQPQLAATGWVFLLATVPLLLALFIDPRSVNGISVWAKPVKFLVSLCIYYWTLAWLFGYLPHGIQRSRAGRFVIYAPMVAGVLEMAWMITAAVLGAPSHFNRSTPAFSISYSLAGVGATTLMVAVLVQGILIARHRQIPIARAFRLALVLGAVVSFAATMLTAGYLAGGTGHWVGGAQSDASGLALLGWSRTGGDLRVAHFWALHASQLIPLAGWAIVRLRWRHPSAAVWTVAIVYVALVAFAFAQALAGAPFAPWLGRSD